MGGGLCERKHVNVRNNIERSDKVFLRAGVFVPRGRAENAFRPCVGRTAKVITLYAELFRGGGGRGLTLGALRLFRRQKLRYEKCTCFSEIEVERKEPGITGNPVALFRVTVEANTDGGIRFRTSIDATCKDNPLLKTISVFFYFLYLFLSSSFFPTRNPPGSPFVSPESLLKRSYNRSRANVAEKIGRLIVIVVVVVVILSIF